MTSVDLSGVQMVTGGIEARPCLARNGPHDLFLLGRLLTRGPCTGAQVYSNDALASLSAPALASVGGDFNVRRARRAVRPHRGLARGGGSRVRCAGGRRRLGTTTH